MAISSSYGALHTSAFKLENLDSTAVQITTAAAVKLFCVEADNRNNDVDVYVKVWEAATVPSVGVTAPHHGFRVAAGTMKAFVLNGATGKTVLSGTFFWTACVTTGGTAGSTSPEQQVDVSFYTD